MLEDSNRVGVEAEAFWFERDWASVQARLELRAKPWATAEWSLAAGKRRLRKEERSKLQDQSQ
jgi:hypothetical protein